MASTSSPQLLPHESKGWRSCWGRLHCFSCRNNHPRPNHHHHLLSSSSSSSSPPSIPSAILPSSTLPLTANPPPSSSSSSSSSPSPSSSSPFVLVPPPSPSFSSLHKPSVNASSSSSSSAYPSAMDSRPFFFDSVLITPPLNSTFTTEPTTPLSTAPFTPPPELAHLTTPPSPELPFAELFSAEKEKMINGNLHHFMASSDSNLDLVYRIYPVSAASMGNRDVPENILSSEESIYSPLPQRVAFSGKNILIDPSATRIAFSENATALSEKSILLDSSRNVDNPHPLSSSHPLQETDALPHHTYRHSHPSSSDLCNAKLYSESLFLSADLASSERGSADNLRNLRPNEAFVHKKQAFMEASREHSSSIVLPKNDNVSHHNEEQNIPESQWKLLCSGIKTVDNCTTLCVNEDFSQQPQKESETKKQAFTEPSQEDSIFSPVQEDEGVMNSMQEQPAIEKLLSEKPWKLLNNARGESESGNCEEGEEEKVMYKLEVEGNSNIHSSVRATQCFIDSVLSVGDGNGDGREDPSQSNVPTLEPQDSSRDSSKEAPKASSRDARGNSLKDSSGRTKENPADRERRFKQIIHWLQIEAKSQAESIFRLSEELSWQEAAFLDLQEQRLADLGIDLHSVSRELSSTEVS